MLIHMLSGVECAAAREIGRLVLMWRIPDRILLFNSMRVPLLLYLSQRILNQKLAE
jgi:hypothetical protein